ncbi:MAG: serine hydrolase [Anaerolineaceae bacterium]|nr:serine hydrolase [Anaerolineaceae bacterium]
MNRKGFVLFSRWFSLILISITILITGLQLIQYSRVRNSYPKGMTIAGVPVGGLSQDESAERLIKAYGIPVELLYDDAIIHMRPSTAGFELDLEGMLAAASAARTTQPFWSEFWNYLWNTYPDPIEIPLRASMSEERLRVFLTTEISTRYDRAAQAAMPIPGTTEFVEGDPGRSLDIDRAVILIEDALQSSSSRVVNLTYRSIDSGRPAMSLLKVQLQQIIDLSGFDGLTEIYLLDLSSGEEVQLAYELGQNLEPNISFTAASTIKIPILVSVYERGPEPMPDHITALIELMIEQSKNDPADTLMQTVLDQTLGPIYVTDDMKTLGLNNTFLAGHFYFLAPLLRRYETPANSREDINTDPDPYNQTTPLDMGMLLADIYYCAEKNGGTLRAVFPETITQAECQQMIDYLTLNDILALTQAGLPSGVEFAHKHGWITEGDGYLHTMGDAGIVFSSGGDYVVVIFMYQPVQLIYDPANIIFADLSRAIYNYFNLTQ